MRRDADELDGFLDFLVGEITHPGLAALVDGHPRRRPGCAHRSARFPPPEPTGTTATPAGCSSTRSASPRCAARPRSSTRACVTTSCSLPRSSTTSGARSSSARGPSFRQTEEGRLLGHVHLGLRLIEEQAASLDAAVRAELLHAVAVHHDRQAARTAEAAVLYHANQLDAQAATRPVGED